MTNPQDVIPILLTSSVVAYDTGVHLQNTSTRLHHTLESLEHWLSMYPKLPIVICDGSSFDFASHIREHFPHTHIECLHFENNQNLVRRYGRGYGEGEIIKFALLNSKTIATHGCFAKCSSKLWVNNFEECTRFWNGELLCKAVFKDAFSTHKKTHFSYVDTRFYIAGKTFYEQYLIDAHHNIDVNMGHGLEECFRDVFLQHHFLRKLLPIYPTISGVGGGTGKYYKNSAARLVKEKIRLGLIMRNSEFKGLFST